MIDCVRSKQSFSSSPVTGRLKWALRLVAVVLPAEPSFVIEDPPKLREGLVTEQGGWVGSGRSLVSRPCVHLFSFATELGMRGFLQAKVGEREFLLEGMAF